MIKNPKVATESKIEIVVGLDADQVPVQIHWSADNKNISPEPKECKAFLLSVLDKETRDTLKIDLWTTEMQVMEMDRLFYQTLRALGDTYLKATNNQELANEMQRFVQYFGEKTQILDPSK